MISFVLPTVQLVAGVARPSWIALPYFIYSCAGLLHWSMTSNFVGLSRYYSLLTSFWIVCQFLDLSCFSSSCGDLRCVSSHPMLDRCLFCLVEVACRGWRPLMYCTGIHIMLQYLYQLPVSFPQKLKDTAEYVGLFKILLPEMGLPEAIQSVALVAFFILVCFTQGAISC